MNLPSYFSIFIFALFFMGSIFPIHVGSSFIVHASEDDEDESDDSDEEDTEDGDSEEDTEDSDEDSEDDSSPSTQKITPPSNDFTSNLLGGLGSGVETKAKGFVTGLFGSLTKGGSDADDDDDDEEIDYGSATLDNESGYDADVRPSPKMRKTSVKHTKIEPELEEDEEDAEENEDVQEEVEDDTPPLKKSSKAHKKTTDTQALSKNKNRVNTHKKNVRHKKIAALKKDENDESGVSATAQKSSTKKHSTLNSFRKKKPRRAKRSRLRRNTNQAHIQVHEQRQRPIQKENTRPIRGKTQQPSKNKVLHHQPSSHPIHARPHAKAPHKQGVQHLQKQAHDVMSRIHKNLHGKHDLGEMAPIIKAGIQELGGIREKAKSTKDLITIKYTTDRIEELKNRRKNLQKKSSVHLKSKGKKQNNSAKHPKPPVHQKSHPPHTDFKKKAQTEISRYNKQRSTLDVRGKRREISKLLHDLKVNKSHATKANDHTAVTYINTQITQFRNELKNVNKKAPKKGKKQKQL